MRIIELKAPARIWKEIMQMTVNDEIKLILNKKNAEFKQVDPAHVQLIHMKINKEAFEKYNVRKKTEIGLDAEAILTRIKKAKTKDMVTIYLTQKNEMGIIIEKPYGNIHKGFFTLETAGMPNPSIPKLLLDNFTVNRKHFIDAVENIIELSDHLYLTLNKDKLEIKAKEDFQDHAGRPRIEKENIKQFVNDVELEVEIEKKPKKKRTSCFSNDMFEDMIKFAKNGTSDIFVGIGTDNPLTIVFSKEKDKKKLYELFYMLAPRIESE